MDYILIIGILAGILQVLGYIIYVRISTIEPNPVTWFMFAYGVAILTILEIDSEAEPALLILPTVCAILAIWISFRCWKKARIANPKKWWPEDWWPEDKWEQASFISDGIITVGYIFAWLLATYALLTTQEREYAVLAFLLLSNISTFPSFYPLLRGVWLRPESEHWLPWAVWTAAYTLLGITTYYSVAHEFSHVLMWYPLVNAPLHALVAVLARRKTPKRKLHPQH